jgi:hypothetical protein
MGKHRSELNKLTKKELKFNSTVEQKRGMLWKTRK